MRKILIDDRNLLQILNDKNKLQNEINAKIDTFKDLTKESDAIQEQITKLKEDFKIAYDKVKADVLRIDEEMKPYLVKLERFRDKINPIVESKGIELGEFELITSVSLENGKVMVEIEDLIENYKTSLRAKKNDKAGDRKNTTGNSEQNS